mmetsp:Transcript_13439/g.47806  ORF Transcript_13439/g.47806 Transcript_13439/m.47806 type:complete len:347 (-) Transcript_13439:201-1241(-)
MARIRSKKICCTVRRSMKSRTRHISPCGTTRSSRKNGNPGRTSCRRPRTRRSPYILDHQLGADGALADIRAEFAFLLLALAAGPHLGARCADVAAELVAGRALVAVFHVRPLGVAERRRPPCVVARRRRRLGAVAGRLRLVAERRRRLVVARRRGLVLLGGVRFADFENDVAEPLLVGVVGQRRRRGECRRGEGPLQHDDRIFQLLRRAVRGREHRSAFALEGRQLRRVALRRRRELRQPPHAREAQRRVVRKLVKDAERRRTVGRRDAVGCRPQLAAAEPVRPRPRRQLVRRSTVARHAAALAALELPPHGRGRAALAARAHAELGRFAASKRRSRTFVRQRPGR